MGLATLRQSAEAENADVPVVYRRCGSVAICMLNRPRQRNSLSEATIVELDALLKRSGADDSIDVVVIAARGSVFSAGHDLKEMAAQRGNADGGHEYYKFIMQLCSAMMTQIVTLPKPVIAAVQGTATAAGCQLVSSCDLAIAAGGINFATPGVNIGLFCSTPMVALSRNIGRKQAMEMLLLGEMIDAATARSYGLINDVVAGDALDDTVMAMADRIVKKSPRVVSLGKEAFYRQAEMTLEDAYAYTADVMARNMMEDDAREGIQAFIDKRAPVWRRRGA